MRGAFGGNPSRGLSSVLNGDLSGELSGGLSRNMSRILNAGRLVV